MSGSSSLQFAPRLGRLPSERISSWRTVSAESPSSSARPISARKGHAAVPRRARRGHERDPIHGRTALVERIWTLRLSGLTDSLSEHHRALLAETPAPYSLPASDTGKAVKPESTPETTPLDVHPSHHLQAQLDQLREEVAAERLARLEADKLRPMALAAARGCQ